VLEYGQTVLQSFPCAAGQLVVRYCSEFEPALLSEDEENEDEDAYS